MFQPKDYILQYPIAATGIVASVSLLTFNINFPIRTSVNFMLRTAQNLMKSTSTKQDGQNTVSFSFRSYVPSICMANLLMSFKDVVRHACLTTLCKTYPLYLTNLGFWGCVSAYGAASIVYLYIQSLTDVTCRKPSWMEWVTELGLQTLYGYFYFLTNNPLAVMIGEPIQNILAGGFYAWYINRKIESIKFAIPEDKTYEGVPNDQMLAYMSYAIRNN